MRRESCERNWEITGLTPDNYVLVLTAGDAEAHNSGERPSFYGLDGITALERAILHRGLTASGRDRRTSKL